MQNDNTHDAAKLLGSIGGKKTWENIPPEERKKILSKRGKNGAMARWGNKKTLN
jgi:hypothetical protein